MFQNWLVSSSSSVLLVHGVPGRGKSSILSAVVDHLVPKAQSNPPSAPCAYFYCAASPFEPDRATASKILRSIIRQLTVDSNKCTVNQVALSVYDRETLKAHKWRTEPPKLGIVDCVTLLSDLTAVNPAYIAIDELDSVERAKVLEALQPVISRSPSVVNVFITSRDMRICEIFWEMP